MKNLLPAIVLILLVGQSCSIALSKHQGLSANFCWKDSYGRGVGTIPSTCGDLEKIGLLCYPKCPAGYTRFGFDCHQKCLSGWSDQGLFCRLAEYGRGAGYPLKPKDGLGDSGMKRRCEADHGAGQCQKNGLIYYPKCKNNFYNAGCCICRPNTPNCNALGYNRGIDLSCAKKIIIGAPKSMSCDAGLEYDAGLCYKTCKEGFYGVGPVCWANTPTNWVGCGMGAAVTSKACTDAVFDQVTSVANLALTIASAGAGAASMTAINSEKAADLKKQFQNLKLLIKASQAIQNTIIQEQGKYPKTESNKSTADILKADPANLTPEDIIRVSAQISAMIDPTGASGVIASYTFPKCSALKL